MYAKKYEAKVMKNWKAIEFVPKEFITEEVCMIAVMQSGLALEYVPKELITEEMCMIAINNNENAIKFIPKELQTREMCMLAVIRNKDLIKFVKEELVNIILKGIDKMNEECGDITFSNQLTQNSNENNVEYIKEELNKKENDNMKNFELVLKEGKLNYDDVRDFTKRNREYDIQKFVDRYNKIMQYNTNPKFFGDSITQLNGSIPFSVTDMTLYNENLMTYADYGISNLYVEYKGKKILGTEIKCDLNGNIYGDNKPAIHMTFTKTTDNVFSNSITVTFKSTNINYDMYNIKSDEVDTFSYLLFSQVIKMCLNEKLDQKYKLDNTIYEKSFINSIETCKVYDINNNFIEYNKINPSQIFEIIDECKANVEACKNIYTKLYNEIRDYYDRTKDSNLKDIINKYDTINNLQIKDGNEYLKLREAISEISKILIKLQDSNNIKNNADDEAAITSAHAIESNDSSTSNILKFKLDPNKPDPVNINNSNVESNSVDDRDNTNNMSNNAQNNETNNNNNQGNVVNNAQPSAAKSESAETLIRFIKESIKTALSEKRRDIDTRNLLINYMPQGCPLDIKYLYSYLGNFDLTHLHQLQADTINNFTKHSSIVSFVDYPNNIITQRNGSQLNNDHINKDLTDYFRARHSLEFRVDRFNEIYNAICRMSFVTRVFLYFIAFDIIKLNLDY